MDLTVGNFTETLSSVDRRIQVMRQFQQLSRGLEARDFNLLMSNINYVNMWWAMQNFSNILQGIVIIQGVAVV